MTSDERREQAASEEPVSGEQRPILDTGDLETEVALLAEKEFSEKIVDTVREGLLVLKPDLTVVFANEPFYQMFDVTEQETVGRQLYDLGNGH